MALVAGGMTLHRQLFLVLRDQIASGALASGAALPTEQALCEIYDVSRITVRRALQDLSDQDYVVRRHGLGTFVTDGPAAEASAASVTLKRALQQAQLETTVEVLDVAERVPPASVGRSLQLDAGAAAVYLRRVRSLDDEPVMVTEAWVVPRFAVALTRDQLDHRALYELLEAAGVVLGRTSQEITAVIADPVRAELLHVDIGSALLRINRLIRDLDEAPTLHISIYATPERSRILTEVSAADVETAPSGVLTHDVVAARPRR